MSTKVEPTQPQIMPHIDPQKLPVHVAIIMDGNGRWAKKRALNRVRGHEEGTESVREIVRTSKEIGIQWLTLYAFSEENWRRPRHEDFKAFSQERTERDVGQRHQVPNDRADP